MTARDHELAGRREYNSDYKKAHFETCGSGLTRYGQGQNRTADTRIFRPAE